MPSIAATYPASSPPLGAPPDEPLDRAQLDRRLFKRYLDARDPVDRDAIVERFLPLARQLAARYQRPEEPFDDVFQVACFGLVKAVDRFDVQRGVAFSSYAVPTIMGEIKRHFRDRTWAVRVPRDLQELALRVDRVAGELTRELGRQPSVDEVAGAIDDSPEDVLEAMQAASAYRATSLDTPRPTGDDEPGETLGDGVGQIDDGFHTAEQRAVLQALMRSLTPREREVVRLRFEEDLTQAAIGERIGVSQMQVSRVLRQALARLRTLASDKGDGHLEDRTGAHASRERRLGTAAGSSRISQSSAYGSLSWRRR
jgi:RNA polymerase sigma-B factor